MKLGSLCVALPVCLGLGIVAPVAADASPQTAKALEELKRFEAFEARANARQPSDTVLDAAGVKPGMVVGEVGAGRGRYTVHLARRVGQAGKIYANDIDADALALLQARCQRDRLSNVETVLGDVDDPRFPEASLDMIFMVWVYHMVEKPVPLLRSFGRSLKPGATVVMVEPVPEEIREELAAATAEGHADVHINVLTEALVREYADQAGFRLVRTLDDLLERDVVYVLSPK